MNKYLQNISRRGDRTHSSVSAEHFPLTKRKTKMLAQSGLMVVNYRGIPLRAPILRAPIIFQCHNKVTIHSSILLLHPSVDPRSPAVIWRELTQRRQ